MCIRDSFIFHKIGINVHSFPLSNYKDKSFYTMRTDALDRFGTKLESRFTKKEIEEMLKLGFRLHKENPKGLSAHYRIQVLHKASSIMRNDFDELAMLIAAEGGKPLIDARIEVERAIDGVLSCASEISNIVGSEIPMGLTPAAEGKLAFTTREPIGLVLAISAFNHPLNLIVHQVAPAVATGCPVIVKPADDTPLSCQRFISILAEAGLPEGWAQMACCDVSLAQKMVTDSRINFFSFICCLCNVYWNRRNKYF